MSQSMCKNHSEEVAANRCSACAEAFCENCLVTINGNQYCADCKQSAVDLNEVPESAKIEYEGAAEALKYALIGIICFGFILEPIAIFKGMSARRFIKENPEYSGSGKATAAIIMGVIFTLLWVLNIVASFSEYAQKVQ